MTRQKPRARAGLSGSFFPREEEKTDFVEGTWSVALDLAQIVPLVRTDGFWLKIKAKRGP